MFKLRSIKPITFLLAVLSFLATSIAISPASATTFGPTVVGPSGNLSFTIPLDDEKAMIIWRDGSGSVNTLKSTIVNADGTLGATATIYAPSATNSYDISNYSSWAKTPDGTIALIWTINDEMNGISKVLVAYTDNLTDWSQSQIVSSGSYDPMSIGCHYRCGYEDAHIAADGTGRLAVQYVYATGFQGNASVGQQISSDGITWSPVAFQNVVLDYSYAGDLAGLPAGGFISSWAGTSGNDYFRYTSRSIGKTATWTSPQLISTTYQVRVNTTFLMTGPNEFTYIFVTSPNNVDRYAVVARRFSLITKAWSPEQTILVTGSAGWLNSSPKVDVSPDGTVGVAVESALDGQSVAYLHFNTFKGSQVGTKTIPVTFSEQGSQLAGLFANPNGSFSMIYNSQNGPNTLLTVGGGQPSETTTLDLGTGQTWASSAVRSPSGNIFLGVELQAVVKALVITRASKPVASSQPAVTGALKVGKKLLGSAITFTSFNGVGTNTYQWFACSAAVGVAATQLPAGCLPIAKATTSAFKLTAKQKGKFVVLAVTNSNKLGSSTLYTSASAKVK